MPEASRTWPCKTLRAMASGGIHDQVGGGFARYSVDATWTVPHFEKMLYDNALLARAYLHGFQLSGEPRLEEVCRDTLDWALREMRGPEGGFYSALDADSEGVEGRFYVWTVAELREALDEDADAAIAWFGATEDGNFVGDPHHLGARPERDGGPRRAPGRGRAGANPLPPAGGTRTSCAPRLGRQAVDLLERFDDRCPGRGWRHAFRGGWGSIPRGGSRLRGVHPARPA